MNTFCLPFRKYFPLCSIECTVERKMITLLSWVHIQYLSREGFIIWYKWPLSAHARIVSTNWLRGMKCYPSECGYVAFVFKQGIKYNIYYESVVFISVEDNKRSYMENTHGPLREEEKYSSSTDKIILGKAWPLFLMPLLRGSSSHWWMW